MVNTRGQGQERVSGGTQTEKERNRGRGGVRGYNRNKQREWERCVVVKKHISKEDVHREREK